VKEVWKWAKTLPRGSSVIDLGCGLGFPITVILVEARLQHSDAICLAHHFFANPF